MSDASLYRAGDRLTVPFGSGVATPCSGAPDPCGRAPGKNGRLSGNYDLSTIRALPLAGQLRVPLRTGSQYTGCSAEL